MFPSGLQNPFLLCKVRNRRFSRSLRCPAVNCPTLNLCTERKGTHAREWGQSKIIRQVLCCCCLVVGWLFGWHASTRPVHSKWNSLPPPTKPLSQNSITPQKKNSKWLISTLPVNDFVLVQILKTKYDAGGIEDGTRLREHVGVNVHHQIAAGCVLHHETYVSLW